jgi:hypothetical protein
MNERRKATMGVDANVTDAPSAGVTPPAEADTYEGIAEKYQGDESVEAPKAEAQPEPEKKDETTPPVEVDDNHPTKLGRKVKDLTEQFSTFMSKFDEFVSAQKTGGEPTTEVADRYGDDAYEQMCAIEQPPVETIITAKDLIATQNWERRVTAKMQAAQRIKYEKGYIDKAKELKEEGGEHHERILAMITDSKTDTPYNKIVKGIPDVDAELNYMKALNAIVSGRSVKETFGKGDSPAGTGVTLPETKEVKTSSKKVELDPAAAAYAKHTGMSEDEVQRALSR